MGRLRLYDIQPDLFLNIPLFFKSLLVQEHVVVL